MGSTETSEKFGSVSKRLILYIVVSSSVITLILTFFQLNIEYQSDLSGIHNRFEQVQNIYLKSVSEVMWASDFDKLKIILEGLSNFADITYVEVREDGNVVVAIGESKALDTITQLIPITYDYRGETIQIGTLRVEADLGAAYKRILNKVIVILGSNAIKTALVVLLMILIFRILVTKPLAQITDYIRSIKIEGPYAPLSLSRDIFSTDNRDEIDIVVDSINESSLQVVKFIEEIREQGNVLKLSERRFKQLFDNSEVSIWNEDFSEVLKTLDNLQDSGLEDLRLYLDDNEQVAWDMAAMIKVTEVNQATLKLFSARSEKDFIYQIDKTFSSDAVDIFKDQLCAIWDQQSIFRSEARYKTLNGSDITCLISLPIPKSRDSARNVPVSIIDITERKHFEEKLRASEARLSLHIQNTPLGCLSWDTNFQCTEWNKSAEDIFGYTADEVIGHHASDKIVPAKLRGEIGSIYELLMQQEGGVSSTNENVTKDGRTIVCDWYNTPILDGKGIVTGITSLVQDVTESKHAEERLKLAASVFTHAREGIMITDATASIIEVNDIFTEMTGYSRDELIGQNPRMLQSGRQSPEFYADMWQAINTTGHWLGEVWNRRKNGEVFAEMLNISAVKDASGQIRNYVALSSDITLMKEHQGQLEHNAHYDLLTNLPNRVLLADRLSQAMVQCQRRNQSLAVAFLDLDGFKAINDSYGHEVGDELLIAVSQRMKEALREGDTLARIGGDEYIALMVDLEKTEDCEPVLERLLKATAAPVTVGDAVMQVSSSIGVTLYPQDGADADQLMRHADQAMYVAKQAGKNCYHLFDTAEDDAIKVQRERLEAIRNALDNQQFVLHYQPKVNMKTGTVTGVEALIRWQHPERGLLNPIEFLPVIENHSMIIEMGEWVIDTALTQISQWQGMGLNLPISTSINIAAVQLQQSDFTDRLATLLEAHPDVEPRYLELEVLETSALDDVQLVSTIMNACMDLGVNFALDDFGTGYSSLTYLRRLPVSLIKIDQSFVRDMLSDVDDLAIVEGVIALAKSFKRDVIAEGVESIEHGAALLQQGCELAQGYGIARPMPAGDYPAWVDGWKPDDAWLP